MITLDTSAILAVARSHDRHHRTCLDVLRSDPGPFLVPVGILAEITFMLERTAPGAENLFLDDLRTGGYAAVWDEQDLDRIQRLIGKYGDLPLGFADACVIACAERYGGRVLTTDRRHFEVVARGEKSVDLLPTILS